MLTVKCVDKDGGESVFEADTVRRITPGNERSVAPCVQAIKGDKLAAQIFFESEMLASPGDGISYQLAIAVYVMNEAGATVATYHADHRYVPKTRITPRARQGLRDGEPERDAA